MYIGYPVRFYYIIHLNLGWLWQDYILYNHYKSQFKKRVDAFGRLQMDIEKEKMREVLDKKIGQCGRNTTTLTTNHFCANYNKEELQMLEEVRNSQRKRSLEIIATVEHNSTKQR